MQDIQLSRKEDTVSAEHLGRGVVAFTTTRIHGYSSKPWDALNLGVHVGDDAVTVQANRALVRTLLPADPQWLDQVHGVTVHDADTGHAIDTPCADAAVTTRPGEVLAILTADCLPVVIHCRQARVLGVAHAGWRGLAAGVLPVLVEQMVGKGACPSEMSAWIGPCISAPAYQVDESVRRPFVSVNAALAQYFLEDSHQVHRWFADLPGIARWQLAHVGVEDARWSRYCTATDPEGRFYSHRRDGQTGRQATLAWMSE